MNIFTLSKYIAMPILSLLLSMFNTLAVHAGPISEGVDSARGSDQPTFLFGASGAFSQISNTLLFIVGAIAVIMVVIGGLRYVLSGGDSSQVQAAKNTILYALVGVIVAILAYAAVNFVVASFAPAGTVSGESTSTPVSGGTVVSPR